MTGWLSFVQALQQQFGDPADPGETHPSTVDQADARIVGLHPLPENTLFRGGLF